MDDKKCTGCGFRKRCMLAGTTKIGEFDKHTLIDKLAKMRVELTPLAKQRFQKLDHNSRKLIALYLRGDNPDKCHMEEVCDANNENCQWVMVCDDS